MTYTPSLRHGWTTGSCATAAAKAAWMALRTGVFPDPVTITLPGGGQVAFAIAECRIDGDAAMAGVVKDAGDDPDATHGALIRARVRHGQAGHGVAFRAGPGVGTITRPGLALPPGEPAINPVPRQMMRQALHEIAGAPVDAEIEISVEDGERIALQTLNGRLGIVGGLSILGTTGIVVPYSCAAWIHTIQRGIDVARASDIRHVAGATGATSERAVQHLHGLADVALIDMGDFAGGMLKYLRAHPVRQVSIAGGVAKMTKLAQGRLDLHSKRGAADLAALARLAGGGTLGARIAASNTVAEAFDWASRSGLLLGDAVAAQARAVAAAVLDRDDIAIETLVFDRDGALRGRAGFVPARQGGVARN